VLKLSSNVSDVFPKVLKLSSEVDECKPLPIGGGPGRGPRAAQPVPSLPQSPGSAVQVHPIKPILVVKAPKTKRLKLKKYELVSSFAFEFSLRRYDLVFTGADKKFPARLGVETDHMKPILCPIGSDRLQAGAYTRSLLSST